MQLRKNQPKLGHSSTLQLISNSGLFSHKHNKENIIQELKRGTLFRLSHQQTPKMQSTKHHQTACWIDSILINEQEQTPSPRHSEALSPAIRPAMLPRVVSKLKQKKNANAQKRRKVCYQRKLAQLGVWNKHNKRNLQHNVSRLEKTINPKGQSYLSNDFQKVPGLSLKLQPLQQSVLQLNESININDTSFPCPSFASPSLAQTDCQFYRPQRKERDIDRDKMRNMWKTMDGDRMRNMWKTMNGDRMSNMWKTMNGDRMSNMWKTMNGDKTSNICKTSCRKQSEEHYIPAFLLQSFYKPKTL